MHVSPKEKGTHQLCSRPVCSLADQREVELRPIGSRLPIGRNDNEKIRGHQRCTHRVVSEHHGRQDGRYDDPKNKKRRKSRSISDVMRNGFPSRSVRRRKQEGVEDALVE
jgi:hypothetical protein